MTTNQPSGDGSIFNIDILSPVKALTDSAGQALSPFDANGRSIKYFESLDWYDQISVERFLVMSPAIRWTVLNRVDGFIDMARCQELERGQEGVGRTEKEKSQLARERLNFLWVLLYPLELTQEIPQVYRDAVKRLREKANTPMLINAKGEG